MLMTIIAMIISTTGARIQIQLSLRKRIMGIKTKCR